MYIHLLRVFEISRVKGRDQVEIPTKSRPNPDQIISFDAGFRIL